MAPIPPVSSDDVVLLASAFFMLKRHAMGERLARMLRRFCKERERRMRLHAEIERRERTRMHAERWTKENVGARIQGVEPIVACAQ